MDIRVNRFRNRVSKHSLMINTRVIVTKYDRKFPNKISIYTRDQRSDQYISKYFKLIIVIHFTVRLDFISAKGRYENGEL